MLKARKAKVEVAAAPVVEQTVSSATVAAAKQARYAPAALLNPNAVIASVAPNVKRGKSAVRYGQFYKVGLTVAEFIASYKAANLSSTLARADLRWDIQHGLITLQS